jgi:hypothetical protein
MSLTIVKAGEEINCLTWEEIQGRNGGTRLGGLLELTRSPFILEEISDARALVSQGSTPVCFYQGNSKRMDLKSSSIHARNTFYLIF